MPQVSVITPVFIDDEDKLSWLSDMIASLQRQTFTDWECILINDNSPLSLGEVKAKYSSDNRLRWLDNAENYGPAMTRNSAVAVAKSECILPVDADDILPNPEVIERLFEAWSEDVSKTVYGNLQVLQLQDGRWQAGKVIQLANYSFENTLNLNGTIPVTAMHSREAWLAAGGWKPSLQYGREDVEYWIAQGAAGFCGRKINFTTLLYRRHENSRDYKLKYVNAEVNKMSALIMEMHADIFKGEYPMGCCGGRKSTPAMQNQGLAAQAAITTLDQFGENEKVWVEYVGGRSGSWQIMGRQTRTTYTVLGQGHKFQVHRDDAQIFQNMNRGTDFRVAIPEPITQPKTSAPEPTPFQAPEPVLATLERLDDTVEIEEAPLAPAPLAPVVWAAPIHNLGDLNIGKFTTILEAENWTVQKLAEAEPSALLPYPGIGDTRAKQIIQAAKSYLEQSPA